MPEEIREGLLDAQEGGNPDNPNNDPEIEPLKKAPFDPENPDCLAFHLPDDWANCGEWSTMVASEFDRVLDYVKQLGTMEKTGEGDIEFDACTRSPELIGACVCGYFTAGACWYIMAARTLTHFNGNKCEPTCATMCVPFACPLAY